MEAKGVTPIPAGNAYHSQLSVADLGRKPNRPTSHEQDGLKLVEIFGSATKRTIDHDSWQVSIQRRLQDYGVFAFANVNGLLL